MPFDFEFVREVVSLLAVLALLATALGAIRRRLMGEVWTRLVLGGLFGLVSVFMMHVTVEPFEGIIIDLRNVPIVLAGAFLGWQGVLVCLACAMTTRIGIGGIGWASGIAAMGIAGEVGRLWALWNAQSAWPRACRLALLGLAPSLTYAATILLPGHVASWFLTHAAPVLSLSYLVAVPLIGALLMYELETLERERQLELSARFDPQTGLLAPSAFQAHIDRLNREAGGTVAAVALIRPRYRAWLVRQGGADALPAVLTGIASRVAPLCAHGDAIGRMQGGRLALPLTEAEAADVDALTSRIARMLTGMPVQLTPDLRMRIAADIEIFPVAGSTIAAPKSVTSGAFARALWRRPALQPGAHRPRPSATLSADPGVAGNPAASSRAVLEALPVETARLFQKAEGLSTTGRADAAMRRRRSKLVA
ncbi:MAG: LytS/YhcK type 5TM receptor domain-containing protein [Pseudomonadota bacterium]